MILDTVAGALIEHLAHTDRQPSPSRAAVSRIVEAATLAPAGFRAFQACVEERESHGSPTVVNASGHAGLYQFSRSWTHALPYLVSRGLRAHGMSKGEARTIRLLLVGKRIEQYPARYQRVAFAQVLREGGVAAAMRHWHLAGSPCNALAGAR